MAAKKKTKKKAAKKKATRSPSASRRKAGTAKPRSAGPASSDRVEEIQRVIGVMVEAGAVELEMQDSDGVRLRIRLKEDPPVSVVPYAAGPAQLAGAAPSAMDFAGPAAPPVDDGRRQVFKSPMVGTFYRAPSPEADAYVQIGDRVQLESTLCILEAMKVMNEIKAETSGTVVEILVQNGEAVEFGQPLFVIEAL